jgi:hypothetical protein
MAGRGHAAAGVAPSAVLPREMTTRQDWRRRSAQGLETFHTGAPPGHPELREMLRGGPWETAEPALHRPGGDPRRVEADL